MSLALDDESKLIRRDGFIEYNIRQQDGTFQPMECKDTKFNRLFVAWVQIHDGYCGAGEAE